MSWVVLLAAAVLAGVATAGVLRPFGTTRRVTLERLADPLEDERLSLLRTLRDLEEERGAGALAEDDYLSLKAETEARAVAVLRALEAREGPGQVAAGLREMRAAATGNGEGPAGPPPRRWVPVALVGALGVAVVVPLLMGAIGNRRGGEPITGGNQAGTTGRSDLAFFEQRVVDHPRDLAARLDLADGYLQSGDVRDAVTQYVSALSIDPKNAEAHANLGFVLYLSGRAEDGLKAVDDALAVAPAYPEGLYFRGVILLRGLHRPEMAAEAFRLYLRDAPFGSRRAEVQRLLEEAERGAASPK